MKSHIKTYANILTLLMVSVGFAFGQTSYLLLDNFSRFPESPFGGEPLGAGVKGATMSLVTLRNEEAWGCNGNSLTLTYNVTPDSSFAFWASPLPLLDFTNHQYISFRIKAPQGKPYLKIQLTREDNVSASVNLWDYLPLRPYL